MKIQNQRRKKEKMRIEEFTEKVRDAVEKELGNGYRVEAKEVRKNNGVILHGLMVLEEGQNVAPTIYLDTFLEAYESGATFMSVLNRLLDICRMEAEKKGIDMEFFRLFEEVRDRICYRLIRKEGNEGLLEDMPYIGVLDLAICFYYAYHSEALGDGTVLIHNSHMELWGTCTAELFGLAKRNTKRLFPWTCQSMVEVLREMAGQDAETEDAAGQDAFLQEAQMKVLSNTRRIDGAVCILYPGVLESLAREEGHDLYILPSSMHEVILLPDTGAPSAEELKRMVREVNDTQVAPEEVLSYSLYRYRRTDGRVTIV